MEATANKPITISATVNAPVEKVWNQWSDPIHIMQWNNASDEWHTPEAENDLRKGGKFRSKMAARDGSMSFDFEGTYDEVVPNKLISYTMSDGRKVKIVFEEKGGETKVAETFDPESTNSLEMQRDGWQAILNNFKKHVEKSDNIKKLTFDIMIDAKPEKVYSTMLDKKNYSEWTKAFNPTSRFEGSWDKGSKILFIGSDENGVEGGMVSRVEENIPNKFVSVQHLGLYKDGEEITEGPEIVGWAGAYENYSLNEVNGKTKLTVELDANDQFAEYFDTTFPKALQELKKICER